MVVDVVGLVVERLQDAETVGCPVYSRRAPHKVESTGAQFVVVKDVGPWGGSNISGRQRRLVRIELHSDCERDGDGLPLSDDAAHRAWAAWSGVDRALNDVSHSWIAVCSSYRADEPDEEPLQGAEHSAVLAGTFEVSA